MFIVNLSTIRLHLLNVLFGYRLRFVCAYFRQKHCDWSGGRFRCTLCHCLCRRCAGLLPSKPTQVGCFRDFFTFIKVLLVVAVGTHDLLLQGGTIVREFGVFQNSKIRVFLRLLEMTCQKNLENFIKVSEGSLSNR